MSTKEQYIEKRQAEIDKWNTEIEELEIKMSNDAEAKNSYEEQMKALLQHRDDARAKLTEIQAAHEDRWEELKDGLEHTWASMKDGFEKIVAKFK